MLSNDLKHTAWDCPLLWRRKLLIFIDFQHATVFSGFSRLSLFTFGLVLCLFAAFNAFCIPWVFVLVPLFCELNHTRKGAISKLGVSTLSWSGTKRFV
jgi:hypothetical protein